MRVDSMDDHMEAHSGAGADYECRTKYGVILCHEISKNNALS